MVSVVGSGKSQNGEKKDDSRSHARVLIVCSKLHGKAGEGERGGGLKPLDYRLIRTVTRQGRLQAWPTKSDEIIVIEAVRVSCAEQILVLCSMFFAPQTQTS